MDGKYNNFWHNDWSAGTTVPHWLILKFNEPKKLTGMNYYARYNVSDGAGRIQTYKVESSSDGITWNDVQTPGSFPFIAKQIAENPIPFATPLTTQYIRFTILSSNGNLGVLTELEFFEEAKSIEEVEPLSETVNAGKLKEEIILSDAELVHDSYPLNGEKQRQDFENALTEAKKVLAKLFEKETTQDMVDKAYADLKVAREKLLGRAEAEKKEKTFEEKLQQAFGNKPYTMEKYRELKNLLDALPKYSKWWVFGPEKLEEYRSAIISGEVLLPYIPEINLEETLQEEKIEESELPLSPLKPADKLPFEDVLKTAWYHQSVSMLYDAGIMKGTSDKTFEPNSQVNRAMLPTVLYRLVKEPTVETNRAFTDIEENAWYSVAIEWAKKVGYVQGFEDGTYRPTEAVTRQDFVSILYRFGKDKIKKEGKEQLTFKDEAEIADYAKEAIAWAVKYGIVKGRPDGRMTPKADVTRAEMAEIVVRFIRLTEKDK